MGCVIAELFMEGKALFDLSKVCSAPTILSCSSSYHGTSDVLTSRLALQLLSYRRGEYDPSNDIAQVGSHVHAGLPSSILGLEGISKARSLIYQNGVWQVEGPMQQLILHMIQLQPGNVPMLETAIQTGRRRSDLLILEVAWQSFTTNQHPASCRQAAVGGSLSGAVGPALVSGLFRGGAAPLLHGTAAHGRRRACGRHAVFLPPVCALHAAATLPVLHTQARARRWCRSGGGADEPEQGHERGTRQPRPLNGRSGWRCWRPGNAAVLCGGAGHAGQHSPSQRKSSC